MIHRQLLNIPQILDQLEADWTSYSIIVVELEETSSAEGVAAMYENPGNAVGEVVGLATEHAVFEIDQSAHQLFDLLSVFIAHVLRLVEEKCCRVCPYISQGVHFNFNILLFDILYLFKFKFYNYTQLYNLNSPPN